MTLLEEFVFALSRTKREKLRPLQFRGTKRKIFYKILDCRDRKGIDSASLMKMYKLTPKRYYLMHAEILQSCYKDIAPHGGIDLLLFLGNKQLYRHLHKEMQRQEEYLKSKNNPKALEQYYFRMLLMQNLFFVPQNLEGGILAEFDAYDERYIAVKKPHPHDSLYLKSIEFHRKISDLLNKEFDFEQFRRATEELDGILQELKKGDHALAKYLPNNSLMHIYAANYFPAKSALPYARYARELLKEHPDVFAPLEEYIMLTTDKFFPHDPAERIERIKKYLASSEKKAGVSLKILGNFFPAILDAGELKWAKSYIANYFPFTIDLLRKDIALFYWPLLALYHFHAAEFVEAELCLQKAFRLNRETDFDIYLRCLDTTITALRSDPVQTDDKVNLHIRYAYRHGYEHGQGHKIIFLKSVRDLMKCVGTDRKKASEMKAQFLRELSGAERLTNLFMKIYNKYFPVEKRAILP
ncbi:MAG: hypothetical protein ACHQM6_03240 [Candidatus Kapaibacterium sp.]